MIARLPFFQSSFICSDFRLRILRKIRARKNVQDVNQFRSFIPQQHKLQQIGEDNGLKESENRPRFHERYPRSSIRHLNLHEDRIPLPIKSLGEPAAIRVLRERPHVPKDEVQNGSVEGETLEEFLKDVTGREGPSSNDEAIHNMEQLRTIFLERVGYLDEPALEDYQILGQSLQEGFTARHLEAYIELKRGKASPLPDNLESLYMGPSYTRSRWFVGDSEFPDDRRFEPELATKLRDDFYIMPVYHDKNGHLHQIRKARLVEEILRQCWGLRTRQEKKLLGSVDVKIDVDVLDLLLRRTQKLRLISRTYGVKIDVAPTLGVLRINGLYETCDLALQTIVNDVQRMRIETVPVGTEVQAMKRRAISLWDSIEQMTSSKIIAKTQESVDILHLGKENLDDARRLVDQVTEHFQQKRPDVQCFPDEIFPVLVPVEIETSLGFIAQQEKWVRWRSGELDSKKGGTLRQLTMPGSKSLIIKDLARRFGIVWTAAKSDHWDTKPSQVVQGAFGSIVHSVEKAFRWEAELEETASDPRLRAKNIRNTFDRLIQSRRAFVTKVPNVLAAMNELTQDQSTLRNRIYINLKPDVESQPSLELEISVNNNEQVTKLVSANLVYDTRVVDLLLPVHPVDVRFTSQTLFAAKPENFDPAILTFLANSNLHLWGKERLRTPQRLVLDLPSSGREKNVEDNHQAQYSFASLFVSSDLRTSFQGFPLMMSTIEAGKSGGHREELKLEFRADSNENVRKRTAASDKEVLSWWTVDFMMWYGAVKEVASRIPN